MRLHFTHFSSYSKGKIPSINPNSENLNWFNTVQRTIVLVDHARRQHEKNKNHSINNGWIQSVAFPPLLGSWRMIMRIHAQSALTRSMDGSSRLPPITGIMTDDVFENSCAISQPNDIFSLSLSLKCRSCQNAHTAMPISTAGFLSSNTCTKIACIAKKKKGSTSFVFIFNNKQG